MELLRAAQSPLISHFEDALSENGCGNLAQMYSAQVRNAVLGTIVGGRYSSTLFDLPIPAQTSLPTTATSLIDDGKKSTLVLAGGASLDANDFLMQSIEFQNVKVPANPSKGIHELLQSVSLLPTSSVAELGGRRIVLTYASPKALGLVVKSEGILLKDPKRLSIDIPVSVVQVSSEEPQPSGFAMSIGASTIWADSRGHGSVTVAVKLGPDDPIAPKVDLDVVGADVTSLTCDSGCVSSVAGAFQVSKSGRISIEFANLGSVVRLSAKGLKGSKSNVIDIPVLRLQDSPKSVGKLTD
jgi:hypothetical protein